MDDLANLRLRGVWALCAICWLCTALATLRGLLGGGLLPAGLAFALSIGPTILARAGRADMTTRLVLGFTIPLFPALFLTQW